MNDRMKAAMVAVMIFGAAACGAEEDEYLDFVPFEDDGHISFSENTDARCDDGVDNDDDGLTDCEDPSCADTRVCGGEDPTQTPTVSSSPTPTPTVEVTPTATASPTPSPTVVATPTPTPSSSPTVSPTPVADEGSLWVRVRVDMDQMPRVSRLELWLSCEGESGSALIPWQRHQVVESPSDSGTETFTWEATLGGDPDFCFWNVVGRRSGSDFWVAHCGGGSCQAFGSSSFRFNTDRDSEWEVIVDDAPLVDNYQGGRNWAHQF